MLKEKQEENILELALSTKEQQRINLEERSYTYWQRFAEQALATSRLSRSRKEQSLRNTCLIRSVKLLRPLIVLFHKLRPKQKSCR